MRKLAVILLVLGIASLRPGVAGAFDKCSQDCAKCHTMSKDQAATLLKGLIPDIKIIDVKVSPVNGLWEIGMENQGKKGILYVDFSQKKIIAGNIFDIATKTNYTQESFQKINKVDYASIPLDNSVVIGDKNAKTKIIVFDDPM
jgi:thiol:disulfide interchange protein DsbC